MKSHLETFFLISSIIYLSFIGCSSTYNAASFESKREFFNHFNNAVEDKKLEARLDNDSILVIPEGEEIRDDSIYLNYYPNYFPQKIKQKNRVLPITKVSEVSYTNHWKGLAPGLVSGLFIGAAIGSTGWIYNYKTDGNHPEKNTGANIFMGTITGMALGAVVGLIVGWDEIYQFNH